MSYLPTDIANQALDAAGVDFTLGDLEEGSRQAQVSLRAYRNCLQQLLRSANWDFARKQLPMVLLADASGQTPNVGTLVQVPWQYCYQYPIDCMKARFIPFNPAQSNPPVPTGNIAIGQQPLTTGVGAPMYNQRLIPARFLVGVDPNYPSQPGQIFWEVQGTSPAGSTVIMTNVQNASLVYTGYMVYPSTWDSLFRSAMVAYLASEIALPLDRSPGKKVGMAMRQQNVAIAKAKIQQARIVDGNEGTYSSDIHPDWMSIRNTGGGHGWGTTSFGPGVLGYGYDSCAFSDGTAY